MLEDVWGGKWLFRLLWKQENWIKTHGSKAFLAPVSE